MNFCCIPNLARIRSSGTSDGVSVRSIAGGDMQRSSQCFRYLYVCNLKLRSNNLAKSLSLLDAPVMNEVFPGWILKGLTHRSDINRYSI